MSVVSGVTGLFRAILGVLKKKDSATVTLKELSQYSVAEQLGVMEYALGCAVGLLARCLAGCRFRTMVNGKENFSEEAYAWNYAPNRNQSAADFRTELVARLVLKNECLVVDWGGQLIIADSYGREERYVDDDLFTQVTRGSVLLGNYLASDVLYFRLANQSLRNLTSELYAMYETLTASAAEQYQHGGDEKILLNIDSLARGNPDFEKNFNTVVNEQLGPFLKAKRAALPLFDGWSASPLNSKSDSKTSPATDFESLLGGALDRVSQALSIPPVLLRGEVAGQGDAMERLLSFCVDPLAKILEDEIVRKRYGRRAVLSGTRLWIDTNIQHFDLLVNAERADKAIASGVVCIDEARKRAREPEIGEPWSKKHYLTKNYDNVEGGEHGNGS